MKEHERDKATKNNKNGQTSTRDEITQRRKTSKQGGTVKTNQITKQEKEQTNKKQKENQT